MWSPTSRRPRSRACASASRWRSSADAFGERTIKGRIDSFAPATGAEFALIPVENAVGNFTKIAQRLPVKIAVDRSQPLAGALCARPVGRGEGGRHRPAPAPASPRPAAAPRPNWRRRGVAR